MFFCKKVNMLEKRIVLLYNIIGNHMFIKEKNDKRNQKAQIQLKPKKLATGGNRL